MTDKEKELRRLVAISSDLGQIIDSIDDVKDHFKDNASSNECYVSDKLGNASYEVEIAYCRVQEMIDEIKLDIEEERELKANGKNH